MKRFLEFLQENKDGKLSSGRLGRFMIILAFIGDWVTHIATSTAFNPDWSIVSIVAFIIGMGSIEKFTKG